MKAARAVKKVRMVYQRQDPYTRPFYVDYLRPEIREDIRDPQSRIGKIFRTRFRVPFVLLEDLYTKTLEMGFKDQRIDIAGRLCVPLASKILGVLRALGRATCFDGIAELAGGSAETHRIFFHKWCKMFARKYYSTYVYGPRTEEEVMRTMLVYKRLGLNGAIGSTDCTHVRWERCPVSLANICTGKEGYATLAWQVTVDHHLFCQSVQQSKFGSYNDKTIVRYDAYIDDLRKKDLYSKVKYNIYNKDGEEIEMTGAHVIADGGFLMWNVLMCGYKFVTTVAKALWSSQMESTRKDVERFFGILKGRFRCLKLPCFLQKKEELDNMFLTCCILHNMILVHDGRNRLWEEDVQWDGVDGEHADEDIMPAEDQMRLNRRGHKIIARRALHKLEDWARVGRRQYANNPDAYTDEVEPGFHDRRSALIEHYEYMFKYRKNELEWLN